jgi:mediator of RNA polymerase II transcription subunit 10
MNKDSVESLEQQLELIIETSRQIGIMASNFQPQSQNALNQKFNTLSNCLRDLDSIKDNFKDIQVPVSVFRLDNCLLFFFIDI